MMPDKDAVQNVAKDTGKAEPTPCPWRTKKKTVFRIGGQDFELLKVGREQIRQMAQLKSFLQDNVKPIFADLGEDVVKRFSEGHIDLSDLLSIVGSILDPELYQKLGELLLLASPEFVEEHFDIGWIVNAAEIVYEYNYGIKRLVKGFFSQ